MGKRKGELTLLMEAAATWDWKVSAILIPTSFLVCHVLALSFANASPPTGPAGLGGVVIQQGIHAFASLLQYVLPMIFLISAGMSFLRRAKSSTTFTRVQTDPDFDIGSLDWQAFESLVAEGFRHRGFQVAELGGAGPDGGVDLALSRGHERFLVQCKQWRARQVGVAVIRELYGVMAARNTAGGYVVTSGSFTQDAKEFAAGRNIELINGRDLSELLRDGQTLPKQPESVPAGRHTLAAKPNCPKCGAPMVLRTAKRGSNAGRTFWGCQSYPKCQSIVARA